MTFLFSLVAKTSTPPKSGSSFLPLVLLVGVGLLGYFFFIRPQQRKAQAARQSQGKDIEVGDEVQTVGGVIGTVLEIHGDRYTLLTGALNDDGNLDGPQPTRIVFVRQAIARKVEPVEVHDVQDVQDVQVPKEETSSNGDGTHDAQPADEGEAEEA
jgi:preprotein translocase YajC subunit